MADAWQCEGAARPVYTVVPKTVSIIETTTCCARWTADGWAADNA
ncbi:MAG: hypothetical protein ACKERG_00680 [Candidatus Hodgkinia cicadicola]